MILITMQRATRPARLVVASYITVSMQSFTKVGRHFMAREAITVHMYFTSLQILSTSWTYFALLNTIYASSIM